MNTAPLLFLVSLLFAPLACGNSQSKADATPSNGNNAVGTGVAADGNVGTVDGHKLVGKSMASAIYTGDYNALLVVVSNQNDYCAALEAGQTHANHVALVTQLFSVTADGNFAAVEPGTYTILPESPQSAGNYALGAFRASDANCGDLIPDDAAGTATSGSIVLAAVSDATASGTYSVTFPSGTVTGSFAAPACAALVAQAKSGADLTCEP